MIDFAHSPAVPETGAGIPDEDRQSPTAVGVCAPPNRSGSNKRRARVRFLVSSDPRVRRRLSEETSHLQSELQRRDAKIRE